MDNEKVLVGLSAKSIAEAAQCWCDPRTSDKVMDVELATVIAEKFERYREALIWCSGSADFGPRGVARIGWQKLVAPLLD